jgi:hypothetical protein
VEVFLLLTKEGGVELLVWGELWRGVEEGEFLESGLGMKDAPLPRLRAGVGPTCRRVRLAEGGGPGRVFLEGQRPFASKESVQTVVGPAAIAERDDQDGKQLEAKEGHGGRRCVWIDCVVRRFSGLMFSGTV